MRRDGMRNNKYSEYKIAFFPEKIESFVEGKISAPIYVRIKPTNLCNHNCFFCVYASGYRREKTAGAFHSGMHEDIEHKDVIPTPKMYEILDDLAGIGVRAVTYSGGGEPLMHHDIVPIMRKTKDLGIDLSVLTNGQLLTKERAEILAEAKWVRVSMDYISGEQIAYQRGIAPSSFQIVMNNIEHFSKIKNRDCDLAVNFIVHHGNHDSIFEMAKRLKDSGVESVRFSPMWIPNFQEYHASIAASVSEQLAKASVLIDEGFDINTSYNLSGSGFSPDRRYARCFFMEIVPVIGADLQVYTCHNKAYDKTGILGSIRDRKFSDLWFSEEMQKVMDGFDPRDRCRHQCANDGKNIFIGSLVDAQFDNFV